jgi:hypothetical protein
MLPTLVLGGLAVIFVAAGAVLAMTAEPRWAKRAVAAGVVSAVLASGLAVAAELQYRSCRDSFDKRFRPGELPSDCKRWPFSSEPN